MKDFLNDLYENFPELEGSKEKIKDAVYYLQDNKPNFIAEENFKLTLKSRLDSFIGLKTKKKSNFLIFALPVFSFIFIIGGFFYYFKDIIFLNGDIKVNKNLEIEEIKVVNKTFKSINNIESEEDLLKKDIIKSDDIKVNFEPSSSVNNSKNLEINNTEDGLSPKIEVSLFNHTNFESNNEEITTIENNDIVDILSAIGETYNDSSSENIGDSSDVMMKSSGEDIGVMSDSTSVSLFSIMEEFPLFSEYCSNNLGEIYEAGNEQICKIDNKECLSSDYINGACEFKKIK